MRTAEAVWAVGRLTLAPVVKGATRLRSYELLASAFALTPRG